MALRGLTAVPLSLTSFAMAGTLLERLLSAIELTPTAEWREAARRFDRAQVPSTSAHAPLPSRHVLCGCPFDSVRSRTAR